MELKKIMLLSTSMVKKNGACVAHVFCKSDPSLHNTNAALVPLVYSRQ